MHGLKVSSWCIYNSISIIFGGFIKSSKGKILSKDKFALISV